MFPRSIQPAYVDSSGGVHEKRPVNRIKELMAKARAAAAAIRLQGMVQRPPRRARKSQKALAAGQGAQKKERRKTVRCECRRHALAAQPELQSHLPCPAVAWRMHPQWPPLRAECRVLLS